MIAVWVVIGFIVIAIVILFDMVLKLEKKLSRELPELKEGDHIPVVKKGESNLTIIRKGVDTVVSDEEGNLIPFKKTLE